MNTKQLTIFGTRHYTEKLIPSEIRAAMELIVDKSSPTIGLEEWSIKQVARSGFCVVCESKKVLWASIGTPPTDELNTYNHTYALDFPMGANIQQHGPFGVQEQREQLMCANIVSAMSYHESAVLVIGIAHLQSMCVKLENNFQIRAYAFGSELL
jgi:hypothetical protein